MSRRRRRKHHSNGTPIAPSVPQLLIRAAGTDADMRAIFDLVSLNAIDEMAEAPFDPETFVRTLQRTMDEGVALMAIIDGHLVGWLGVVSRQYSYSKASFLIDTMFWVLPQHRDGDVWWALLQEARGIADAAGMKFKLVINNPSRKRGVVKARAEILGYSPVGTVLTFSARGH